MTAHQKLAAIVALLKDETGEWRENVSGADFVQEVSILIDAPTDEGDESARDFAHAIHVLAERMIEDDRVGTFEDSNAGQAAARAAADLVTGWNTYDAPYQKANAHKYQPYDVNEVTAQLHAWKAKGCPTPTEGK